MKQTQRLLMTLFATGILLALLLVVLYETDILEPGTMAGKTQEEFVTMTMMELLSLAGAFLGLRMFMFGKIHQALVTQKAPALLKFGVLRLVIIETPMVANTLFYYIYMKPTFGYLAIILALCLPFVVPTMWRCEAETTEEEA